MTQPGANDELFSIIIESILSWDETMQRECAQSFLEPIRRNMFTEKNAMRIASKAIAVINELLQLPEHDDVVEPWIELFGAVVTKIKMEDHSLELVPFLIELTNIKATQEFRKVGNKILFAIATAI